MPFHGLTMEPKALRAWTTALRSGDYEQGNYALRDKYDRYCCLGVKAAICNIPAESDDGSDYRFIFPNGKRSDSSLETSWFAQFFVYNDAPADDDPRGKEAAVVKLRGKCMEMNDSKNLSFPQIADWLEENLGEPE